MGSCFAYNMSEVAYTPFWGDEHFASLFEVVYICVDLPFNSLGDMYKINPFFFSLDAV